MEVLRAHAVVRGRVQGVFYRASAVEEAERRGLVGWVRNCADGSVELEAEGPAPEVRALIDWARQGPPAAEVTGVDVDWRPPLAKEAGFRVKR